MWSLVRMLGDFKLRDSKRIASDEGHRSTLVASALAIVFVFAATGIWRELEHLWPSSGGPPTCFSCSS